MSDNPFSDGPGQASMPSRNSSDSKGGGMAIASLVLGILGVFGACLPICGLPINLVGLILGFNGLKSQNRGMAIAGIILSGIGMVLTLINAALGAYLAATGQNDFINQLNNI